MASAKCFCDDCQRAATHFESLPDAPKMLDEDGGTPFDLYRNDRYRVVKGADMIQAVKTKDGSITNRNLATCCNSVLFASFDRGPHWISVYRPYIDAPLSSYSYFVQTRFAPHPVSPPAGTKSAASYPPGMMVKLMGEKLKQMVGL